MPFPDTLLATACHLLNDPEGLRPHRVVFFDEVVRDCDVAIPLDPLPDSLRAVRADAVKGAFAPWMRIGRRTR